MAELSSFNRNYMANKFKKYLLLAFTEKQLAKLGRIEHTY